MSRRVSSEQAVKWNARVGLAMRSLERILDEYEKYRPEEAEHFDNEEYIEGFYSRVAAARAYLSDAVAKADP